MLRLVVFSVAVLGTIGAFDWLRHSYVKDDESLQFANMHDGKLDLVVTGKTVSQEHLMSWNKNREMFLKCGLCDDAQPFPGD